MVGNGSDHVEREGEKKEKERLLYLFRHRRTPATLKMDKEPDPLFVGLEQ